MSPHVLAVKKAILEQITRKGWLRDDSERKDFMNGIDLLAFSSDAPGSTWESIWESMQLQFEKHTDLLEYMRKEWICDTWRIMWIGRGRRNIAHFLLNTSNSAELFFVSNPACWLRLSISAHIPQCRLSFFSTPAFPPLQNNLKNVVLKGQRQGDMVTVLSKLIGLPSAPQSVTRSYLYRQYTTLRQTLSGALRELPSRKHVDKRFEMIRPLMFPGAILELESTSSSSLALLGLVRVAKGALAREMVRDDAAKPLDDTNSHIVDARGCCPCADPDTHCKHVLAARIFLTNAYGSSVRTWRDSEASRHSMDDYHWEHLPSDAATRKRIDDAAAVNVTCANVDTANQKFATSMESLKVTAAHAMDSITRSLHSLQLMQPLQEDASFDEVLARECVSDNISALHIQLHSVAKRSATTAGATGGVACGGLLAPSARSSSEVQLRSSHAPCLYLAPSSATLGLSVACHLEAAGVMGGGVVPSLPAATLPSGRTRPNTGSMFSGAASAAPSNPSIEGRGGNTSSATPILPSSVGSRASTAVPPSDALSGGGGASSVAAPITSSSSGGGGRSSSVAAPSIACAGRKRKVREVVCQTEATAPSSKRASSEAESDTDSSSSGKKKKHFYCRDCSSNVAGKHTTKCYGWRAGVGIREPCPREQLEEDETSKFQTRVCRTCVCRKTDFTCLSCRVDHET